MPLLVVDVIVTGSGLPSWRVVVRLREVAARQTATVEVQREGWQSVIIVMRHGRRNHWPSPVQVFQVTMLFRIVEAHVQVLLNLRNRFEIIWHLEPLQIWHSIVSIVMSRNHQGIPWTILASLWYLLKFRSDLLGSVGAALCDGLPSRQKVTSVR